MPPTEPRLSATTIRQIEFELEKAERGMPYDAERVMQLRNMLCGRRAGFGLAPGKPV
jgi:hypothetical protein